MKLYQHVASRIRLKRNELNISLEALSQRVDIEVSRLRSINTGKTHTSLEELYKFAEFFDVRIDWFFETYIIITSPGETDEIPQETDDTEELLRAFSTIQDPVHRRAVVQFAADLADISRKDKTKT